MCFRHGHMSVIHLRDVNDSIILHISANIKTNIVQELNVIGMQIDGVNKNGVT